MFAAVLTRSEVLLQVRRRRQHGQGEEDSGSCVYGPRRSTASSLPPGDLLDHSQNMIRTRTCQNESQCVLPLSSSVV